VIRPGKILFEIGGVDEATARDAFRRADAKLPLKTKFVKDEL
ncbi:MAG: 50S ribosomal protein L16, partial [Proteobacteria bacterium]|nr:50S ribosomal protein L16 [Pseudomonadota bacterium]